MITDALINFFRTILGALLGLLPNFGTAFQAPSWFSGLHEQIVNANAWVPVAEFGSCINLSLIIFGGMHALKWIFKIYQSIRGSG